MRKYHFALLAAVLLPHPSALANSQVTAVAQVTKAKTCSFPKSRKRAPNWLCNAPADGTAVGSTTKSDAGTAFMQQMAVADARTHLAQKLRGTPQKKTADKGEATDNNSAAPTSRITHESLQGTKILKRAYGPDGTLYVLVGFKEKYAH